MIIGHDFKIGDTVTVVNAPDMPHWLGITGKVIHLVDNSLILEDREGVRKGPMHYSRFVSTENPVLSWLKNE
jgi:RNase P/RNase MRP subunit p29